MKSKKVLFVFGITILLLAGWLLSVRSSTGAEVITEQKQLVEQADQLAERKLYVRAIELYKEALQNKTSLTVDIQEKLLQAYEAYGDMDDYCELAVKRAADGTAKEEEYLKAAEYYVEHADLEEAVPLLESGIAKLETTGLQDYLEQIRYAYTLSIVGFEQILPTEDNTLMPAYNGEKWGYINNNGRVEIAFDYDSVTAFGTDGFAVVQQNDTYYSI